MAWTRKILRVNLTDGACADEPLNMEWADKYLGQRGLATKYLYEEIDPKCDPLGPDNKLIFATGPLTGTPASTGGRYSVVTKGALTGAIACSNSGGFFGAELKFAGYDMVIVEGVAPEPVYLTVFDGTCALVEAGELWGKSVWEADAAIKARHGDPAIRVATIGVPGETGVLYACIINDLHRAAGRSGVGAVMGAKRLKAVAVRGTGGVAVEDPERFKRVTAEKKRALMRHPARRPLTRHGTNALMNVVNESGALKTRNAREVRFEGARAISSEAMAEPRGEAAKPNLVANAACFGCSIACGRISRIDPDHYTVVNKPEYWHSSGGLEFQAAAALGAATGVDDLDALTYANFLCNEQGLDPISFGATLAAAMELYEAGVLTPKDTGGLALEFGSAPALTAAVELTARGEGFGRELGQGSARLATRFGRPELSMTVKGQELPAFDPRGAQGMGLAYATANRGACHTRGYAAASELLGWPEKADPLSASGKAVLVKTLQDETSAVDSSGLCLFTTFAWTLDDIAPQLDAACAGGWTRAKLAEVGERIWNLERRFNLEAGFTASDDTLPKRLLKDAAEVGPAAGRTSELERMLPEYYRLRGWTGEGVPTNETVSRLAL